MVPELAVWLILLLPVASFAAIACVVRPFFNRFAVTAGYITILAITASLALSARALASVVTEGAVEWPAHDWLSIGEFAFGVGILLDPLTAVMLVVVTGVSLMVQVYSLGYMKGDPGFARYYAYMSLFTASMIGLVLASNILQLFVFWELVGLCSYLLIGFWYQRPAAAAAAKKAFIVTRVGDFGFLLAILYLFFHAGAFSAEGLNALVISDTYKAVAMGGVLSSGAVTWIAVGIFAGAVGKSAQFPLHTWLPDAMEGPTPVSALIHAATMVAAGVFLVARFFPLFEESTTAMNAVAVIGGFTALFAATMGLVANDIKRVLAYSTVSQLGFMMLALGVGAYGAAIFHLFTHAFFKALLFLGSGSVNHATGTFDMRYMGGLRRQMPWTYATFLVGSLSLAGIFPLAGFWSKDEILAHAWHAGGPVGFTVYGLAIVAVFMTAFYIFRAVFMTFYGEFKGGGDSDPGDEAHGPVHLAESPPVMVWPLGALAVAAVLAGVLANPLTGLAVIPAHWLTEFLDGGPVHVEVASFGRLLATVSSVVAAAGFALAYGMYYRRWLPLSWLERRVSAVYTLLSRKYYFDELYEGLLVTRYFYAGLARALDWTDRMVIDRAANAIGWLGANFGSALRQAQTGQLQGYGAAISVGIVLILGIYIVFL